MIMFFYIYVATLKKGNLISQVGEALKLKAKIILCRKRHKKLVAGRIKTVTT